MTPCEEQWLAKVAIAIRQTLYAKQLRQTRLSINKTTVQRGLGARNIKLATLARIFDAMGADLDLVVTLRKDTHVE